MAKALINKFDAKSGLSICKVIIPKTVKRPPVPSHL